MCGSCVGHVSLGSYVGHVGMLGVGPTAARHENKGEG